MLGVVSACAADDTTIDHAHDACAPLAIRAADMSPMQASALTGAFALWRDHGAPRLGEPGDATIELAFRPAAAAFRGLYDDEARTIYINDALADQDVLEIVIAHELGHALGLPHVDGDESVMIRGNTRVAPGAADAAALEALWGPCPTSSSARPGT